MHRKEKELPTFDLAVPKAVRTSESLTIKRRHRQRRLHHLVRRLSEALASEAYGWKSTTLRTSRNVSSAGRAAAEAH